MRSLAPAARLSVPPTRRAARAASRWTTPRRLQAMLLLGWLTVLALALVAAVGVRDLRQSLGTIGGHTAASVITAQQIRATLSDLDANAASDLLAAPKGARVAHDAYEGDLTFIGHRLLDAARNISFGDAERKPIETISDDLGQYAETVTRARDAGQQSPADGAYIFQQATTLLHQEMLPAADALTDVNARGLARAYRDHTRAAVIVAALILLTGAGLLVALIGTQAFLLRRTRRIINAPLLAASVLAVALLAHFAGALIVAERSLATAKEGAYTSLDVLWRARALAADARGDESLALLDPTNAARYHVSFGDKMHAIVDRPVDAPLLDAATRGSIRFNGYLADELRNVTFPAEGDAALDSLRAFGQYQWVDERIRDLERQGKHADAIALTTGTQSDQANGLFDTFDRALYRTIYINDTAFDREIVRSETALRREDLLAIAAAAVIAGLVWLGLQPRLREYAV